MFKGRIDRNVFSMGLASFFNDVGSEMILSILPLFLTNVLGAGQAIVGLIEGIAEATSSILKLLSGWLSDKFDSRKPLVLCGYSISTIVKPILAFANTWPAVLAVRFFDRVGKGVRTSPRDALIAASSTNKKEGRSFGFHRTMDTLGAVVGTLIAFGMLYFLAASFELIFLLTIIPGILAVITIAFFVKEKKTVTRDGAEKKKVSLSLAPFGKSFKRFIFVSVLFTLSNFSYAFLLLRANDVGIATELVPLVYLFYNIVYVVISIPLGDLADKIGKVRMLSIGFFVFGLVSLGFGFIENIWVLIVLFGGYAVFLSIYEVSSRAFIPELVRPELRGTAYGVYHTATGLAAFPASAIVGGLWQFVGVEAAFSFAAALALVSSVLLLRWVK